MPTHKDLLNAEVAFILYNGQVYMSHPTDNDVSLTKLIRQIGNLGHLDNPLVESIQAWLRGSENAPNGLELVGRYNMSNGRIAPYGPVNSAENQQTVRDAVSQAAYDTAGSSQEPARGDASTNPDTDTQTLSSWRMGRQFMPLVDKVTQDKCPFCGQKRSLYHMKDGYQAQAMGVYGHPLCRDCLTTRMDQHEQTTGQRISRQVSRRGFVRTSADIREIAQKALQRLYIEQNIRDPYTSPDPTWSEAQTRDARKFVELMDYLLQEAPETYKLWPFVFRSYKKDRTIMGDNPNVTTYQTPQHIKDILQQATAHLERLKDDPRSEVRVPNVMQEFKPGPPGDSWGKLQQWVYEQNGVTATDEPEDETTVFQWPDGWTIKELGADALGKEGELMGHCVGGYCNSVRTHTSHIFSLRDPKNGPHVTFEIEGQPLYEQLNPDRSPEDEQARQTWHEESDPYGDPSVYQPAASDNVYHKTFRPALTPSPSTHPMPPTGPWGTGKYLPHPNEEGYDLFPDQYPGWPSWNVIQIQGKQDEEPIPEYRKRINEYMTYLREKEGVPVEWHPTDAIRPGGQEGDDISSGEEALKYYEDYKNGSLNAHDYPSEQNKGGATDDYGLPKTQFSDDNGLYVFDLSSIVDDMLEELTEKNTHPLREYGRTVTDPQEAARAVLFLVEQLKIQEAQTNAKYPDQSKYRTNWDMALEHAIEQGYQILDVERDNMRDMNSDYEHESLQYTHEQIWEDKNRENGVEEGDEGYEDPADHEFDWDHPDMMNTQNYIDNELYAPWKDAGEFLQLLQGGSWMGQNHQDIQLPGEKGNPTLDELYEQRRNPQPQPTDPLPGALSKWALSQI